MLSCSVMPNSLQPPWTVARQAPLSMGFPMDNDISQWSGLQFPTPGDLPNSGINLRRLHWQANSLPLSHQGSPTALYSCIFSYIILDLQSTPPHTHTTTPTPPHPPPPQLRLASWNSDKVFYLLCHHLC